MADDTGSAVDSSAGNIALTPARDLRTPAIIAAAFVSGLLLNLRNDFGSNMSLLIIPAAFGVAIAWHWQALNWQRQLLILAPALLVLALGVGLIAFPVQLPVGTLAWAVTKAAIRFHRKSLHAKGQTYVPAYSGPFSSVRATLVVTGIAMATLVSISILPGLPSRCAYPACPREGTHRVAYQRTGLSDGFFGKLTRKTHRYCSEHVDSAPKEIRY